MRKFRIEWIDRSGAPRVSTMEYRNKTAAKLFKMHPDCHEVTNIEEVHDA